MIGRAIRRPQDPGRWHYQFCYPDTRDYLLSRLYAWMMQKVHTTRPLGSGKKCCVDSAACPISIAPELWREFLISSLAKEHIMIGRDQFHEKL